MKSFTFLVVSTFFIGIVSGAYLYFTSRSTDPILGGAGNDTARGFEITADAYGGCQMLGDCPSYHVRTDGEYIFLISHRNAPDDEYRGTLSDGQLDELRDALRAAPLARIADSEFAGTCPIAVDGPAYRYEIRIGEDRYSIDTCREDADDPLFELLGTYFNIFWEAHADG